MSIKVQALQCNYNKKRRKREGRCTYAGIHTYLIFFNSPPADIHGMHPLLV